jgi:mannitol/fructose-specific phosphotransferase system IIA component
MTEEEIIKLVTETLQKSNSSSDVKSNFISRWIRKRLQEPSTYQGLIIIIPIILTYSLEIDSETATKIVIGSLALVAGHNVVRSETDEN